MKKKIVLFIALCLAVLMMAGCGLLRKNQSDMPFNGPVQFHDLTLTIPSDFIRDSTQSNEDLWTFEKGFYKKMIIIKRSDGYPDEDVITFLDSYVESMQSNGAESVRGEFLYRDAVKSTYEREGTFCQEILFEYNNSYYAFALRGGTEEEFNELLNQINTPETLKESL